jgi:hypothetical protein
MPSNPSFRFVALSTALFIGFGLVFFGLTLLGCAPASDGQTPAPISPVSTRDASRPPDPKGLPPSPDAAGSGTPGAADAASPDMTGAAPSPDAAPAADLATATGDSAAPAGPGPKVDRANPQLYALTFKASQADPRATRLLGDQQAFLDTQVAPQGTLVVHLHGSGEKTTCGYADHGRLLAGFGFHVFMPCYDAAVSWNNSGCGGAVGDCRLEMLDGMDHSARLNIGPGEAIEVRVAKALTHLATTNAQGDWGWFLDGEKPRWDRIIISGQSFGATSSLLIAKHRPVRRAVALSGPLDNGAAWLKEMSMTPVDRMFAFTHVNDGQHPSHRGSIGALGLPGDFVEVEKATPPYGDSHRLVGSLTMFGGARIDGHNATEARMQSPREPGGKWLYEPVWRYLYGVPAAP